MLKRHEVEILLRADHRKTEVALLTGVSLCSVKRIAEESPVVHVDDAGERAKRKIGRPSTVANFRKQVVEILQDTGSCVARDFAASSGNRLFRRQDRLDSRHAPPCLRRASRPPDPAKMKVQTEAGEMDRTRPNPENFVEEDESPTWRRTVKRQPAHSECPAFQLELPVPELDERQNHLCITRLLLLLPFTTRRRKGFALPPDSFRYRRGLRIGTSLCGEPDAVNSN